MVLQSIPSPSYFWQIFYVGSWIHSIIPAWPAGWTLAVHTYALCILAGIIVAVIVANRRLVARGGEPWVILDVAIFTVILGIVVARLYHVVTHPGDYFPIDSAHPLINVFAIWDGGDAIFGSLIGGVVGIAIGCRVTGLRFWSVADAIAPGVLLAQALGRFGNYFNHELYGLPTNAPWGLQIESTNAAWPSGLPAGTLYSPTFLYELILNVIGFIVLMGIDRKFHLQWGRMLGLYLIWYGLVRTWMESIRVDPSVYILGLRSNVWAAIAAIVIGAVIFIVQSRRHKGLEPSVYRPGKQWEPEQAVDSEDTYSDYDDLDDAAAIESGKPATSGAAVAR